MRSSERLTVPILLCRTSARPMREQLIDALRQAIDDGLLPEGSQLPSTRTLAGLLGVSRGVAVAAYEQLHADGAIHGTGGSGTYVSGRPPSLPVYLGRKHDEPVDLRPGQACAESFPLAAWRSAWRQASYLPPPPGHPPGHGIQELRAAIANHVRRAHGYAGATHQVVITSGPRHGLRVLRRVLAPRIRWARTDPGPPWFRAALPADPIPLDGDGIRVEELPAATEVVLLAQDGDAPMGVRTAEHRRLELADWARRCDGWLVTIGGDVTTESRPLPSLLTLGPPERTAVLGDLGELLTPAASIGYLVLPRELADLAARQIASAGEQPALLCQRAAAELFRTGTVARRANQLAAMHARKLAMVRELLDVEVRDSRIPGTATVLLPNGTRADRLIATCRDAGVLLTPLRDSYAELANAPAGVVLGFGQLADTELASALRVIASAIREPVKVA